MWWSSRSALVVVTDPADEAAQMGPLISADHRAHVRGFVEGSADSVDVAFRGTAQTLQDLYDIAVKFAATIGDGINPAGTRALEAAYADLITLLEGKVQPALRQGRYPDRKTAQRISEVVRAVARELDH